ncbi:MAG: PQQ-binding-like beta-propeller repeat protein [Candidatus Sumerlaeota bacterium]|nr:PQQ-binding-like beta-propeller repeat protein [Candidatus Sumerlaeota bacterium]
MFPRFISCILAALLLAGATSALQAATTNSASVDIYIKRANWAETVLLTRRVSQEYQKQSQFKPYAGKPLSAGDEALRISIDVRDVLRLALVASSAPKTDWANAVWADGVLTANDGATAPLEQLAPVVSATGKDALLRDKDAKGKPLSIKGKVYKHGLLATDENRAVFNLDGRYQRLEVWAGISDSAAKSGQAILKIEDDTANAGRLWNQIQKDFPGECERAETDLPKWRHLDLLQKNPATAAQSAMPTLLEDLRPYGTEYDTMARGLASAKSNDAAAWVGLYGDAITQVNHVLATRASVKDRYPDLARLTRPRRLTLELLTERLTGLSDDARKREFAKELESQSTRLAALERALVERKKANETEPDLARLTHDTADLAARIDHLRGWPAFRGNSQRSGVSRERLQAPLASLWTHTPAHPPTPAWPAPAERNISAASDKLEPSLTYDRAYHVTGMSGRLYYGSSADDSVVCLDASNGQILWSFVTEGPVRMAPALSGNRLYAGSDDGNVYCLDAASGRLIWKAPAGPSDRRLPGNNRMISRWPVRCGVVVENGIVYFGAGLFPPKDAFLCALRAEDGRTVYREALDVPLQGYLLATPTRLFLPTGRTPFRAVDRSDGKSLVKLGKNEPWGLDLTGGCFALVVEDQLATGPSEDGQIHFYDAKSNEKLLRATGRQLLVNGDVAYLLSDKSLSALNRRDLMEKHKQAPRWTVPCKDGMTMTMAQNMIFVAGQGWVRAFDPDLGKPQWETAVEGRAEGMAICEGRLLISTDDGKIYCFGPESLKPAKPAAAGLESGKTIVRRKADVQADQKAKALLAAAQAEHGYCLVLDAGDGEWVERLAASGHAQVIGVESDATKVSAARARLSRAGLSAAQATMHTLDWRRGLPYTPYCANLIVLTRALSPEEQRARKDDLLRVLRPAGGVIAFEAAATPSAVPDWTAFGLDPIKELPEAARRGALPGAGEWTHFFAGPGNTACSEDVIIRNQPLSVAWFGLPGPRNMIDRHKKTVAPLYKDGRLFVSGNNYIAAVDAYNGAILWERNEPESARTIALKNCGNMAAGADALYLAAAGKCLVLDPRTGTERKTFTPPDARSGEEWGYLALDGDRLFGSVAQPGANVRRQDKSVEKMVWGNFQPVVTSLRLFCLGASDGAARWTYQPTGAVINPTLAAAGGRLYFVESDDPATLKDADGRITLADLLGKGCRVVALDAASGKKAWQVSVDLRNMHHILYLSAAEGTLLLTGSRYIPVEKTQRLRYDMVALDWTNGAERWRQTFTPDYEKILTGDHGEQIQHPAIVPAISRSGGSAATRSEGAIVYGPGFAVKLADGKPHDGWVWHKGPKCATVSASGFCVFTRFAKEKLPYLFDLATGANFPMTTVSRPGCYISIIPAGGMVLIPESSAGCTCEYPIQTSLALVPADLCEPR